MHALRLGIIFCKPTTNWVCFLGIYLCIMLQLLDHHQGYPHQTTNFSLLPPIKMKYLHFEYISIDLNRSLECTLPMTPSRSVLQPVFSVSIIPGDYIRISHQCSPKSDICS